MDSHKKKLSSWSKQDIKETIEMGLKKKSFFEKTNMLEQSQIKTIVW